MRNRGILVLGLLLFAAPASTFANDLYQDGIIYDLKDFAVFASYWMDVNCSLSNWCNGCDFDMSGAVDANDLRFFAQDWLSITSDDLAAKAAARDAADIGFEQARLYMLDSFSSAPNQYAWLDSWYDPTSTTVGYSFGPVTHGDAEFQYEIYKGNEIAGYEIVSTGTAGSVVHTVHATMSLRAAYFPLFGIRAAGSINVRPGGDLYTMLGNSMVIKTDSITRPPAGGIILSKGLNVPGDVIIGTGGDINEVVRIGKNVTIEGDILSGWDGIQYPSIFPPFLPPGVLTQDPCDSDVWIISDDGEFGPLNIGTKASDPAIIEIRGRNGTDPRGNMIPLRVYINGDMTLGPAAQLIVTQGSAVEFYLGGSLEAKNGSVITYSNINEISEPSEGFIVEAVQSLTITGTDSCNSIILKNSSDLYGSIYAPEASLQLSNSSDFYGVIIYSAEAKISNSGDFYYVAANLNFADIEVLYTGRKHGSWWEDFVSQPGNLKETFESVVRKSRREGAVIGHLVPSLRILYYSTPNTTGVPDLDPDMYAEFYLNDTYLMLDTGTYDPVTGTTMQTSTEIVAGNIVDVQFSMSFDSSDVEMAVTFTDRTVNYSASRHN